jgi:hypothetical protein
VTAPVDEAVVEPAGPVSDGEFPINLPVMVIEQMDTSDGRLLTAGSLSHRALPLSLLAQPESMHGGSDAGPAGIVGRIDTMTRVPGPEVISKRTGKPFPEGTFVWSGTGHMSATAKVGGYDVADMFRKGHLRGISVDLAGMDYEVLGDESPVDPEFPRRQLIVHGAEVAAATLVPIPAYADAYAEMADGSGAMVPADDAALAASAFPSWRSAEVGDYSPARAALIAAADEGMPVRIPADSVEQLAAVIDSGEQRDAPTLATAIVEHIAQNWAATAPITEDELPEDGKMAAKTDGPPADGPAVDDSLDDEGDPAEPQACIYSEPGNDHPATMSLLYQDGEQFVSVCDDDEQRARDELEKAGETVSDVAKIPSGEAAMADKPGPLEDEIAKVTKDAAEESAGDPTAPQSCRYDSNAATRSVTYHPDAKGKATQYIPVCDDEDEKKARDELEQSGEQIVEIVPIDGAPAKDTPAAPVVVAAGNVADLPDISWFRDPQLIGLTPLTVTEDGRVWGHLAAWGQDHVGLPGQRIRPPRSAADYGYFHTGALSVDDAGQVREISVGKLTMDTGHAGTSLGHSATVAHYDHSGSVVAQVCCGEDEHGIWYAGALMPGLDELSVRRFRGCGLSGDWRKIGNGLELVAALSVPVPGFPVPRARVASGEPQALVAAGAVLPVEPASLDVDALADLLAEKLDARRTAGELSAKHADLVAQLDDTPTVVAALLAEVDDSPTRMAALFAELDEPAEDFNWVEKAGGLPKYIKRIATHLQEKGQDESRAIATAVNAVKKMCSTGDLNFPGSQQVNPDSQAEACAAVAEWEEKKARA